MKIWLRRCHLLLALLSGLFLINLSVSGALLVFGKEIQYLVNPSIWTVTPKQSHKPLSDLIGEIETYSGSKVKMFTTSPEPELAWQARLMDKTFISINQYTGDVLLQYNFDDTFYGFVMYWHRWLIYESDNNKRPLKLYISIASLILIIEILFGLYMWFKPKKRLKRLKVKPSAKPKVLMYQLHTVIGVFSIVPLILIAFSGMAFHWKDQTKQIVNWLSPGEIESRPVAPKSIVKQHINLDFAYEQGQKVLSSGDIYRIYLPTEADSPLALRIKMPKETYAYSWVWVDIYTGEILKVYDAQTASMATQVWHFKYKFHIGDFIGLPVRILWLFISLLPLLFVITGAYILYFRKKINISR